MAEELLKNYAKRLGVYEIDTVKKATELLRRIDLNSTFGSTQTAKVVFCLEAASMQCGTAFDFPDEAIRYSGLNQKEYARQKNTFDLLLGLNRQLKLKDICLQLELPQSIQTNAQRLLKAYERSAKFKDDIQSAHCLTMAVYQCCKQQKIKQKVKNKLFALSNLDGGQWKQLEDQWNRWIASTEPFKEKSMPIINSETERTVEDERHHGDAAQSAMKTSEERTLDYEEWKAQMIAKAMAELNKLKNASHDEITIE